MEYSVVPVLLRIAVSLALGVGTPLTVETALTAIALVSLAFVFHAVFIYGPVDDVADLTEEVPLEEVPETLSPLQSRSSE